jgi:hypothetical protein
MKYKVLASFLIFFIVLFSCNDIKSKSNRSFYKPQETIQNIDTSQNVNNSNVFFCDSLFSEIDKICLDEDVKHDTFKIVIHDNYSINLKVYYHFKRLLKLEYTVLDDDSIPSGIGTYYFDKLGFLVGNKSGDFFTIYNIKDTVILYEKIDGSIQENSVNTIGKLSKIAISNRIVNSYLSFFNIRPNYFVMPSDRSIPTIKVKHANLYLRDYPEKNSVINKDIKVGTRLIYLNSTNKNLTFENKKWVWYYVMTEDGIRGWIFGHPDFIIDLNDENYND